MTQFIQTFASEVAGPEKSLFGALGIDWRMLLLQLIAFGIMVWVLGKFVYPHLIKAIDAREDAINESVKAAANAELNAEKTQAEIERLFKDARAEASSVIETAHREAAVMVKDAEDKATMRAEQIVKDARVQLDQDVVKARKALREEATELVALATEQIIRQKVDTKTDAALIAAAIEGVK
jgi:F-type H+-transporting ATPase subunit b